MTDSELLSFVIEHDMIDVPRIRTLIKMNERKELLNNHPYKIWQGKDGKWYTYIRKDGRRFLKKRRSKSELQDFIVSLEKEKANNPTLEEVFNEWNNRRLELGKISASSHLRYYKLFHRHYRCIKDQNVKSVNSSELIDFLESQISECDLSAKAFSNLKTITKGLFKRAKRRGLIDWNIEVALLDLDVTDAVFRRVVKEDYQEVFNDEERERITSYLLDNLDALNIGILLLFATGMRVGELMALTHEDVVDQNTIKVRRTETCYLGENDEYVRTVKKYPKTAAGIRTIIVPDNFARVVILASSLNSDGEYLFEKNGKRMTVRALEARLSNVCDKLNIYHKSPHKIRKTYGSILLDNHIDSRLITDQMGHTNIATTERFYHRNRKDIESKRKILGSIPEFKSQNDYW